MLAGSVVGLGARTPLGWLEAGAAVRVPVARAVHLAGLVLTAAVAAFVGSLGLTGALSSPSAVRNLLGFAGLACVCAAVNGALAWVLPVSFGLASLVAGSHAGEPRAWAWPIQDDASTLAWALALGALLLGAVVLVAKGTAERDDERQ